MPPTRRNLRRSNGAVENTIENITVEKVSVIVPVKKKSSEKETNDKKFPSLPRCAQRRSVNSDTALVSGDKRRSDRRHSLDPAFAPGANGGKRSRRTVVIRDAVTYTEHAKRKTVTAMDVVYALKR